MEHFIQLFFVLLDFRDFYQPFIFNFHFITITNMRTALLIFLIVAVCAQQQLNYLSGNQAKASVEDLVNRFAQLQTEIYKKVFQHYMFEELANLRSKGQSQNQVKQRVVVLLTDPNGPLFNQMTKFMQERLFKKLEIGLLTSSLHAEIIQNPQNFYMTFDIYDLLFD